MPEPGEGDAPQVIDGWSTVTSLPVRGRFSAIALTIRSGIIDGMKITIDSAGRLVVPKRVRDAAGLAPGTELELRLIGDTIQLTLLPSDVRLERRGHILVAVLEEGEPLTQAEVDATVQAVRSRASSAADRSTGRDT